MVSTEIKKIVLASQILHDALEDEKRVSVYNSYKNGRDFFALHFFTHTKFDDLIGLAQYYDTNIKLVSSPADSIYDEAHCMCGDVDCHLLIEEKDIEEFKTKCFESGVNFVDEREDK